MSRLAIALLALAGASWCSSPALAAPLAFEPPVVTAPSTTTDVPGGSDSAPVAATNGSGTWVVAWESNDTLQGTIDRDHDILFSRSTDGGLTFTAPAALNTNAGNDSEYFYDLVVGADDTLPALAANGNRFIAVWNRQTHFTETIALSRSDDGGATWSDLATLYDLSNQPSIANDGAGTWVIVWRYGHLVFGDGVTYFTRSTNNGLTWSAPVPLNTNAAADGLTDSSPQVAWSNGVWVATWTATLPFNAPEAHVRYARSVDGATWSAPLELSSNAPASFDQGARVVGAGGGNWVATWSTGAPNSGTQNIALARSADGALTWTPAAILNTDAGTDGRTDDRPSVAAIDAATYAAVWVRHGRDGEFDFSHSDVLSALSSDGGATWSAPIPLNPAVAAGGEFGAIEYAPHVVSDPLGYFFALWTSNDPTLESGTKGQDHDIVMALAGHPCGDGTLDPGEACDDGDRGSLDCCGRTCAYDPAGAVCAADAEACTLERCDGAGTCNHEDAPFGTPCALDTDLCTNDRCDGSATCEHVYEPRTSCITSTVPHNSRLTIGGGEAKKRKIGWTWKHGPAIPLNHLATYTYGAPYALCVYDGSGLVARTEAPVDDSCKGTSCWRATNTSLKYSDGAGTPSGATSGALKASAVDGKTSHKMTGRGANLAAPALPSASLPVHAQLVSDEKNICFDATYSGAGVQVNSPTLFKAKSD